MKRIQKSKQLYIEGWGLDKVVKIDRYFKELPYPNESYERQVVVHTRKYNEITLEIGTNGDDPGGNSILDMMHFKHYGADYLSIHSFNFNEKGCREEHILHFIRMGYLSPLRSDLTNILWNEHNITWDLIYNGKQHTPMKDTFTPVRVNQINNKAKWKNTERKKEHCAVTGKSVPTFYQPVRDDNGLAIKNSIVAADGFSDELVERIDREQALSPYKDEGWYEKYIMPKKQDTQELKEAPYVL